MEIVAATQDGKVIVALDVHVMTVEQAQALLRDLSQTIRVAQARRPIELAKEKPKE